MTRIDSHHHFWHYDPVEYAWISEGMSAIRRSFEPRDLALELKPAGISGVVSVQARQTLDETWQLLTYADQNDFIRGVVGWVPLSSPDLNRILATVASHPKLRGVRHVLQDEPDPNYILREDFNRGVSGLKPFHLTYDILIYERHLPQTIEFVDRHPNQVFVVDHLAKPRVNDRIMSPWRENIQELASRDNVYCKISGLVTEADHQHWTEDELRPYMDVVLEAFSPKRVMFGSDWPVCLVAVQYREWVKIVERAISGLSPAEQERVWSGTAREAYRLS
jgi:L-fuconolactonase